jgi:hypothetical protein
MCDIDHYWIVLFVDNQFAILHLTAKKGGDGNQRIGIRKIIVDAFKFRVTYNYILKGGDNEKNGYAYDGRHTDHLDVCCDGR